MKRTPPYEHNFDGFEKTLETNLEAHKIPHTPNTSDRGNWEDEFEKVCDDAAYYNDGLLDGDSRRRVKEFIASQIAKAREEGRSEGVKSEDIAGLAYAKGRSEAYREIREACESMKQEKPKRKCLNAESHLLGSCFQCVKIDGYNAALDRISSLLKDKGESQITKRLGA